MFQDRAQAGRALASALRTKAGKDPVVLGLPRGGVVTAYEVARALGAPLDVMAVRKLGAPLCPELALGAIASGGTRALQPQTIAELRVSAAELARIEAAESAELARRERLYRGDRAPLELAGRTVLLVDDGLATGATMTAAARAAYLAGASRVIAAAPVGSPEACLALRDEADEVVCLELPSPFYAVGSWYEDFSETTDDEVRSLLGRSWRGLLPPL